MSRTPPPASTAAAPSSKRVTRPLGFTLGLGAVLAALTPLVVATARLFDINAEVVRDDARALHTAVAQDLARAIDDTFDDARAVAVAFVDSRLPGPDRVSLAVTLVTASRVFGAVAIYGVDGSRIDVIGNGSAEDLPLTFPEP